MKHKIHLVALLVVSLALRAFAAEPAKPNIVYILVDDMGYTDAGFNGSKEIKTPHIDALAKQGAVLKDFYVQPVCSPTRATLMTGRYPTHTGVYSIFAPADRFGLPLAERTLADGLRGAGYTTAICGKWHLGKLDPEYTPTKRGFDHQYGLWGGAISYTAHQRIGKVDWHRQDQPSDDAGYSTTLLTKDACQVISDQTAGKPLFLYLPFNAVHSPYEVAESYQLPYAHLSKTRKMMAGLMASVDEAVGQVVAALEKKGLLENTLIIFSSDNGGVAPGVYTDNLPLRSGKGTIYEGGVRVCAFATWPGKIPAGTRIREPMHGVDWYPTLLKLAGASLDQPLPIDGRDVWPMLTQGAKSPHDAILLMGLSPDVAAVRMGDWKLLLNASDRDAEDGGEKPSAGEKLELYNLADDIGETKNLAAAQPEKVKALRAQLAVFLKNAAPPVQLTTEPNRGKRAGAKKKNGAAEPK